ncbi:DNA alkylation repair protein [Peribacillus sp. SCS-155]|uniref:DNA alkylation repair protein n=1 Tax=Peribacillus sedimenti TaxID=3115297 RepID=UPI003906B8C6
MNILNQVYRCPACKTNRSKFNMIHQVVTPVRKDPQTGAILEEYTNESLGPLHIPYRGPEYRVQCGVCGMVDEERSFVAFGAMR